MATALKNEKIIGGMGIAAVIVFIVALFAAAMMKDGFDFGTNSLLELASETAFVAGCVIAGVLGALFGFLVTYKKNESKVFIGKIRGLAIIIAGAALVLVGLFNGDTWTVYLFMGFIVLSVICDTFYNWVADQKLMMVFSLFFTLTIALTGILSQTSNNNALGFMFILFVALWMIFTSAMRFAPVVEAEPEKGKTKKEKKKEKEAKKNAPAPRPYPAKKEAAPPAKKKEAEKPAPKEEVKKVEEPKKVEVKKEEPKPAEPKKEELPKLKVMSSRQAAMARESARKKEEESVPEPVEAAKPEPTPEPEPVVEAVPEPEPEPEPVVAVPVEEPAAEVEVEEPVEEEFEEFEMEEETPDALLRRATWNKGLRCRRDYGEHQIPIAFVKAKVAVYVMPEAGDTSIDDTLRSEGWTVLRYLESDISDGKEQAEEINKAVKENLKAERAAKKKKTKK